MKMDALLKIWDKYWFSPVSPAPLCLFRIIYGLLVFVSTILWAPDLFTYFGPHGLTSVETMHVFEHGPRFSLFFAIPGNETFIVCVFAALLLSSITVTLGLFTRASLIVLLICLVSFHHRNIVILHSGDTLLRIYGFFLLLSPAGAMFSFDNARTTINQQWQIRTNCWTQRLFQLQMAAVYCQAYWAKAHGETWWNGTAVYYASRLEEFAKFPVPYVFDHLWTCQLLTWGTLAIELALWTLIWFKEVRYYVLICGVLLHLGIDWSMNLPLFEYIMIACYINFVDAADLKKIYVRLETLKFSSFSFGWRGIRRSKVIPNAVANNREVTSIK